MAAEDKITAMLIQAATIVTSITDAQLGTHSSAMVAGMNAANDGHGLLKLFKRTAATQPNPLFASHGFDGTDSPVTLQYLRSRQMKKIAGSAYGLAGMASSAALGGHNAMGAVSHGHASALTLVHLARIEAIAETYRQSRTVSDWCRTIRWMKGFKATSRGAKFAGAIVPAASMPVTIAMAVLEAGVQLTWESLCLAASGEIHWRAFQEQAISGGRAKAGPATRIVEELFTKRGATIGFGSYDVAAIIREPAGWQAIGDKIALI